MMTNHPNRPSIDNYLISLIKGMLLRGDYIHDIAVCFGINQGRPAEISNALTREYQKGEASLTTRARDVKTASEKELPPRPPYLSPYELWKVRVALEHMRDKIEIVLGALSRAEEK